MNILTDDAFVRFVQRHVGVDEDGIAGPDTLSAFLRAIGRPVEPPKVPPGPGEWTLDARSLSRLEGVHPDLVRVVHHTVSAAPLRFVVLEGLRTIERQRQLVASGASQTMRSRHLTGHAVDIAPLDASGRISWDWPLYHRLAPAVKQAAEEEGVPLEWGGDWRSFKDGPHWQLPWASYPA